MNPRKVEHFEPRAGFHESAAALNSFPGQEKFKEVAFKNLKAYMEEERVVGFTLTRK